jgi:quercetin dioxygenase-like cupin family protein
MAQRPPTLTPNPSEEAIAVGPTRVRFLVTGDDSSGSAALLELALPAGSGLPGPPHSHDAFEETVYVLEGAPTWTVGGRAYDLEPGQALCIPRGAVHAFANHGGEDARALVVISPAALGPAYFREVGAVLAAGAGGPPDRARMAEVMRRHGLTPAPAG